MNGVHDLGGTDGLGPVVREQDEPVWHADWEKVCFALFPINAAKGFFGVDEFRFGIEQMHPAEYLLSPYYEHWLHTVEHYAVKAGAVDREELERRTRYYLENPDAPVPEKADPELAERMASLARSGAPARRDSDRPARFSVGDRVRVKDDSPFGHTRRARYIRGRTGVIEAAHGTFIYPDSAGNGRGDDPQHVYTVAFRATDLWGEHGDPNSTVRFDVWEPYLEQA